jgi:hypothetical protein
MTEARVVTTNGSHHSCDARSRPARSRLSLPCLQGSVARFTRRSLYDR